LSDDKENLISTFNDSVNSIQRLNECWRKAAEARIKKDYKLYKLVLEQVEDELWFDAEEIDSKKKEFEFVKKLKELDNTIEFSFLKLRIGRYINALREKERVLRRIQQKCGKGSAYKERDEDDFD